MKDLDIVIKTGEFEYGLGTIWLSDRYSKCHWRIQNYQSRFGTLEVLEEKHMNEFLENSKSYIDEIEDVNKAIDNFKNFWGIKNKNLEITKIVDTLEQAVDYLKDKENETMVLVNV